MNNRRLLTIQSSLIEAIHLVQQIRTKTTSIAKQLQNDDSDLSHEGMILDFAKDDFNEILSKLKLTLRGVNVAIKGA